MSVLDLPALQQRIQGRHRSLIWAKWRTQARWALLWASLGTAVGFNSQPLYRALLEGPIDVVTVTPDERRSLDLLRVAGVRLMARLSPDDLRARLSASASAIYLAVLLDGLPDARAATEEGWLIRGSPGRLGRADAIAMLARYIAEQPPDRRASIAELIATLGVALPQSQELVHWVAELPRSAQNAPHVAALRHLANLPATQLQALVTIAYAYRGPGEGYARVAPYPCLDAVSNAWKRGRQPFPTCTVGLH